MHFQVMTGEEAIRIIRMAGRKDFIVGATGNALKSDQASYLAVSLESPACLDHLLTVFYC